MHPRPDTPRRRRPAGRAALLVLGLLAGLLWIGQPVATATMAAQEEEQSNRIFGTLRNSAEDGAPVEGVDVVVTAPDGQEYTATSDAEGAFEVEVPGKGGKMTIELDTDTLPEGVALREEGKDSLTRVLSPGQAAAVVFPIGPSTREVESTLDQVPQLLYNGLIFGIFMALGALGLSMVFGTTGLTNFAHGELVTFGALVTFMFNVTFGFPFAVSALLALILGAAFGWLQDTALWRPLRRRGTGLIAMMIVSIGLQFFLRNVFAYVTGSRLENYDEFLSPAGRDFAGLFTYTYRDIVIATVSILVLTTALLGLSFTRLGRATRAVADNPALAAASGINVDRVISLVWIVGTALAALAGTFLAFQLGVTYQIGQLVLLLLFSAVCVGGLGSVWGALVGSLIIGVLIELSALVIPSDLKNAGALFLLIIILLVRPQGLLGRRERIG